MIISGSVTGKITTAISTQYETALNKLKKSFDKSMSSTIYEAATKLLQANKNDPLKLETITANVTKIKGQTFKNEDELFKALLTPLKQTTVAIDKKEIPTTVKASVSELQKTKAELASVQKEIVKAGDQASQNQYVFDCSLKTTSYMLERMSERDMSGTAV